ncbi:glycosyltransferase family 4 protein [bacterium]|nr:glycosyltransferase family 4 protein [bacterium]
MINKKSNNLNILYLSSTFVGGIGGHAFRVSEKLNQNGFDIELMKIPHIPIKNLKNISFMIFGKIKTMFNKKPYDLVHAWNVPSGIIMKNISAKKKILSIHGVYGEQVEAIHSKSISKLGKIAEKNAITNADILTTDSKFVQKEYLDKFGLNIEYLPAPLDVKKFINIPKSKLKNQVVFIGRDSYEKGIDILKSIELSVNCKVIYCTNLDWVETMKILQESKLLVVPSRQESLPQVIKEAFYLKIPVIATDVGGVSELVKHNQTGILVPSENPEKLKTAINDLLENSELQEIFKKNAYDFILEYFTWEKLLPTYTKFYKNLLNL